MPEVVLTPRKTVFMALEGVGSYKTGTSPLASADARRCTEADIKDVPEYVPRADKTFFRDGAGLVKHGNSTDVNATAMLQTFNVPNPADDATRPEQHELLRMCGFIETWVNAAPIYRLDYQLHDNKGLMDSGEMQIDELLSDASGVVRKYVKGIRMTSVWRFEPGKPVMIECTGKGVGYEGPTDESVITGITLNILDPEIRFQEEGAVTITNPVAGGKTYDGPIALMEFEALMSVQEQMGGDLSGRDEITLIPTGEYAFRVQIDKQAVTDYNARDALNQGQFIQVATVLPTAVAGNTFETTWQGQIQTLDTVDSGGKAMYTLNCLGVYKDTTPTIEPGRTPVLPPIFSYVTDTT